MSLRLTRAEGDGALGLKLGSAGVAALASWWNALPVLGRALIALMVLDLLTGFAAAFVNRELSSKESLRGITRKVMVLLIVGAAAAIEPVVRVPLAEVVAGFYVVHEALSVVENVTRAGVPVPRVIRDALVKLSPEAEAPEPSSQKDDRR